MLLKKERNLQDLHKYPKIKSHEYDSAKIGLLSTKKGNS